MLKGGFLFVWVSYNIREKWKGRTFQFKGKDEGFRQTRCFCCCCLPHCRNVKLERVAICIDIIRLYDEGKKETFAKGKVVFSCGLLTACYKYIQGLCQAQVQVIVVDVVLMFVQVRAIQVRGMISSQSSSSRSLMEGILFQRNWMK